MIVVVAIDADESVVAIVDPNWIAAVAVDVESYFVDETELVAGNVVVVEGMCVCDVIKWCRC